MRALHGSLAQLGFKAVSGPDSPRLSSLPKSSAQLLELYAELGGVQAAPVLRPGGWDLAYDGLIVELDEQLHFNRYRAVTLQAPLLEAPWDASYRRFSITGESRCRLDSTKLAGKWSTPGSKAQFGDPSPPGVLEGPGAPRWKQRAIYDAMKDAAAAEGIVVLARISIYDGLGDATVDQVLEPGHPATIDLDALSALISDRTFCG